ncbi:GNAT family N-acetyltransferase [uncultured Ilyobacter sp.]|uniref:GNAT family N-acetyltransferase n=1 Tax=uncultured Ilyobacter sp. TaxID=544433 RepID=UPI0029F5B221|nr:GNAT family N-acetyltransferase [uncultured Ilyobacter sp.]
MVTLKTERLYLKVLGEEAVSEVAEYYKKNREFFKRWESSKRDDFFSESYLKMLLRLEQEEIENGNRMKLWIFNRENNKIIGFLNFGNIIRGAFDSCFLGYKLDKDETGKGYMTEALKEGMAFYFDVMKLHRIEVNLMPQNVLGIKTIERVGFIKEGISEKYLKINGKWEDHIHYVMLKERYEKLYK